MPHLALALLGPFQATVDGLPAERLTSDRLRALLAYLAVRSERAHSREQVAALLWPERPDREALAALRYALSNLQHALGDRRTPTPFLLVTRTQIQFNLASDHWLDVAEFDRLLGRSDVPSLEQATTLYRGPFLDGLSVADSPAFDEWLLLKGEEYRRGILSVLGHLAYLQMARGENGEAARWARRQIELEPYREQAHRQLMAALALGGERSAALVHYDACRRLLAEELGCEPDDETQALAAQIRDGTLSRPQPVPVTLATVGLPSATPTPSPRLVAREQELARLGQMLDRALAGQGGIALIAGEMGGGKTALLDEWARRAAQTHSDLIVLRGRCNAHAGAGDPYLPFREMLQTLAGDVEGKRAGGTLSPDQARRVWETLPVVGAALVDHGPDLIDSLIPGEALLRRAEAFPSSPVRRMRRHPAGAPAAGEPWQARLRELVRRSQERAASTPGLSGLEISERGAGLLAPAPQPDLFAQVTQVLHTVSLGSPLLLAIDDLHWADAGTAALLFHLGRRLAGSRILLACAYRPVAVTLAEQSQVSASGIGTVIQELTRQWGDVLVDLDRTDGRAFVEAYVDSEPNRLDAAFREALYDHTGGNPLFTAELLDSLQREGALVRDGSGQWIEVAGLDWDHCPSQVEQVIAGHVAALPAEDRALLQAASVQGNRFAAEIVARVLVCDEETVVRRLGGPLRTQHRLVSAVSLDRLATSGQRLSYYRFRHWLVQRSVYRSLDAVERARLHEATGRALEAIHAPSVPPALAPELARHFETAGMPLDAVRYHLQAGRWAARLVAYDDAIAHLERGLALMGGLPPSSERLSLELALCLALIVPASMQGGWQAPAFRSSLERLADLTQHPDLRDDPQRLDALTVLATGAAWSADPKRGRQVGEQLLDLVQGLPGGDRQALMLAHCVLGQSDGLQGRLVDACEHLGQALTLHSAEEDRGLALLFPGGPEVTGWTVLGLALWLLGYADQGRAALQQAVACAQEIGQPSSLAFAHLTAAFTHLLLGGDEATVQDHVQALRSLDKAGSVYGAWATLLVGAEPGPVSGQATGADPILQAAASGAGQAGQLLMEAQGLVRVGQAERAMAALDQAKTWIERTGMRMLEAEVWRVRGETWLLPGAGALAAAPGDMAEASFRRAQEVARGQQARWLELRAAVSLARLWQSQGRRADAHDLLVTVYTWFTEGFDAVDLLEAKNLLEQLA